MSESYQYTVIIKDDKPFEKWDKDKIGDFLYEYFEKKGDISFPLETQIRFDSEIIEETCDLYELSRDLWGYFGRYVEVEAYEQPIEFLDPDCHNYEYEDYEKLFGKTTERVERMKSV